jgi:anti-sigma regulatory factor (Ser/Thr protein kinase)
MERVSDLVKDLPLSPTKVERLKTAVAETTMNAMEHGNQYQPDLEVKIKVLVSEDAIAVRITDFGGGKRIPEPEKPDLEAKLAGLQSPRGWGLFLIENMVDEMSVQTDETHHTVELVMKFKE